MRERLWCSKPHSYDLNSSRIRAEDSDSPTERSLSSKTNIREKKKKLIKKLIEVQEEQPKLPRR